MFEINKTTIKIVGNWNTKIFTPAFVNTVLLNAPDSETLEIEFTQELQPIFIFEELRIVPKDASVEIIVTKITDESIKKATRVIFNLLTALPYTPNLALGFNYSLNYGTDPNRDIFKPEMWPDFEVKSVSLSKQEENFVLNVVMNFDKAGTTFYNFHILKLDSISEMTIPEQITYINSLWKI